MPNLDWSLPVEFTQRFSHPLSINLDALVPVKSTSKPSRSPDAPSSPLLSPFINAMKSLGNALTENNGVAHKTTNSPLVDLFFELTPGIQSPRLFALLESSWREDPTSTLRLIIHARSIHEGKGANEECFKALAWVWDHHPRTLLENLHMLVDPLCKRDRSKSRDEAKLKKLAEKALKEDKVLTLSEDGSIDIEDEVGEPKEYPPRPHGKFKDLVDLLILHINGQFTTNCTGDLTAINESIAPAVAGNVFKERRLDKINQNNRQRRVAYRTLSGMIVDIKNDAEKAAAAASSPPSIRNRLFEARQEDKARRANIKANPPLQLQLVHARSKQAKHLILQRRLIKALNEDKKFQALYLTVLDLFVSAIKTDLIRLSDHRAFLAKPQEERKGYKDGSSPHLFGMSYAAKWAPSPAKGGDKQLHFATALALALIPNEPDTLYRRGKLQKEILAPLRAATNVPETQMGKGAWKIDYTKVPARAMSRNAQHFAKHDTEGFSNFLRQVTQGRYAISGASMFPHELLLDAISLQDPVVSQVVDLQWSTLVDSIRSSSVCKMSNCLAIADVSGSMGFLNSHAQKSEKTKPQPISVCIALTLLLGELAEAPWKGSFFTFSSEPTFETIDTTLPLSQRATTLSRAHWGMSTDFAAVFEMILSTAVRNKLDPKDMVKRLFVFSDMQFNAAKEKEHGETEHQAIKRKFEEAGYELPEMVYWNLAARFDGSQPTTKPAQSDMKGVSLVSGFSGSLMKFWLGVGDAEDEGVENKEKDDDDKMEWEAVEQPQDKVPEEKSGDNAAKPMEKKKKDPMDTVKKILAADSLAGVKVVD